MRFTKKVKIGYNVLYLITSVGCRKILLWGQPQEILWTNIIVYLKKFLLPLKSRIMWIVAEFGLWYAANKDTAVFNQGKFTS